VEVHGSYTSVMENGDLAREAAALEQSVGKRPIGNRQHWLRFDDHQKLFDTVARAHLVFDSSLGFAETVGFRNGVNCAFPPYDFRKEAPFPFLEIPLALMDGNLEAASRSSGEDAQKIANEVLEASRKRGGGGLAVLWHNPFEPIQVPDDINDVFWARLRDHNRFSEKWMTGPDFARHALVRYHRAGLLQDIRLDA